MFKCEVLFLLGFTVAAQVLALLRLSKRFDVVEAVLLFLISRDIFLNPKGSLVWPEGATSK